MFICAKQGAPVWFKTMPLPFATVKEEQSDKSEDVLYCQPLYICGIKILRFKILASNNEENMM